jgi:hypothetical protein
LTGLTAPNNSTNGRGCSRLAGQSPTLAADWSCIQDLIRLTNAVTADIRA